jgi:hypothetical protein
MKIIKDLTKGFLQGLAIGIPLTCLIIILINSHQNRVLIKEVAKSQILIIEIMREKKIVVVDSLIINLPEGACNDNNNQ